jgi:spermidine synthase
MTTTQAESWPHAWLWHPSLLAFLSSASIMTLEMVVGRITAPYVGVSLYAWTVVIGVVLAGITFGNRLGGRLADRWSSPRLLGGMLALGGLVSWSVLGVDDIAAYLEHVTVSPENLLPMAALALLVILLCFLPCVVLGTISPILAKLAVRDLSKTGRTLGRIYAAGTVGSIVGTFATGFFLIYWIGTHPIIWGVGLLLLLVGLLFLLGDRWPWLLLSGLLVAGGSAVALTQGWLEGPCTLETNYYCIRVREEEREGEVVRLLFLDRLVHSYSHVDDPTQLVYGYEKLYAETTAYQAARSDHLRALFIGGGGYTFPRYMEALYPSSDLDVIEIDPGVTEIAHEMLGLSRDTDMDSYNEDARMFLKREPTDRYNLIFGDAFNDFSIPYHLTTKEFNDRVHAWLTEDGLYVVNLIDGPWGHFLRAYVHTLRQTFSHVYVALDLPAWRQTSRSTILVIATDQPLDVEALQTIDAGDDNARLAELLLSEETLASLMNERRTMVLTDRYAPTDLMLLPVFLDRVPR